jgi:hypothetical protein
VVAVGSVDQLVQGSGLRQIEAVLPATESSVVLKKRVPKIAAASRMPRIT